MQNGPNGPWETPPKPDESPDALSEESTLADETGRQAREPFFNLPGGVAALLALLLVIHAIVFWIVSDPFSDWLVLQLGFSPIRYVYPLAEQDYAWIWTPFTYSMLHGGIEHLLFNGLWLAAFGTPVWRRIGGLRFGLLWLATAAGGAFAHAALNWGQDTLLVGASGVISGLMGAACRFAFGAGRSGFAMVSRGGIDPARIAPRLGIAAALAERTVLIFILVFLAGNLVIALGVPLGSSGQPAIAWDAHLGGFAIGFLGFALFDRRLRPSRS